MKEPIIDTLALFASFGRSLSAEEISRNIHLADFYKEDIGKELVFLCNEGSVLTDGSFFTLKSTPYLLAAREAQSKLYKEKIEKVLRIRSVFQWVPFVDFVLLSGSLALGTPHEDSDIDLIIGARNKRIFIVRFISSWYLWLLGLRRHSSHGKTESRDKICLNHFVTARGYELKPPRDSYWFALYKNLIPIFGDKNSVLSFFEANRWALKREHSWELFLHSKFNLFRFVFEEVFEGGLGDLLEKTVRYFQVLKFNSNIRKDSHLSRVYFNDHELELHPDTTRINGYLIHKESLIKDLTI